MTDLAVGAVAGTLAPRRRFVLLRRLAAHRSFQIGLVLVLLLALAAIFAPFLTSVDPSAMKVRFRFRPPPAAFPFGTDNFGRDIFTRVLYGARVSLWVGVIVALPVAYVPAGARIVRASALVVRELDYIAAARIAGASNARIMIRHMLPNSESPLLVHVTFVFAYAILAEAALSFLGVGVPPPTASWGNIIAEGRDYATESWWVMLFPGLGITLSALGLNLLGDGLRDVLDPRLNWRG